MKLRVRVLVVFALLAGSIQAQVTFDRYFVTQIKWCTATVGFGETGAVTGKDKLQDHTVRSSKIDVVL